MIEIFGKNKDGQCNIPDLERKRVVNAAIGEYNTCLVLEDGTIRFLGYF